jgi:CubicO group peptidase (beta-lactamase class C family)
MLLVNKPYRSIRSECFIYRYGWAGTHDQYNQMAYQSLQRVFETATGNTFQNASTYELYRKLSIIHLRRPIVMVLFVHDETGPMQFESATYWQMNSFFLGVPQKHPLVYGGVTTTCPDLARFGLLWMNQGNWSGHQVFTKAFYEKAMSQPQMPFGKYTFFCCFINFY